MAPPQARKAREIAVGRDEFAAVLDGQGRDIGIRHEGALDVAAQTGEQLPMSTAGRDERGAGPTTRRWQKAKAVSIGVAGSKMR
jgi:hypothetical protein